MSRRQPRRLADLLRVERPEEGARVQLVCTGRASHRLRLLAVAVVGNAGGVEVTGPGIISKVSRSGAVPSATYSLACSACGREVRMKSSRIEHAVGPLLAAGFDTLDVSKI